MERKQKRTKGNNSTRNNERENENGEVGKDNLEDEDVKRSTYRCITTKSSAFSSSMFQKCLMQVWNYVVDFLALLNSCNRFPDSLN